MENRVAPPATPTMVEQSKIKHRKGRLGQTYEVPGAADSSMLPSPGGHLQSWAGAFQQVVDTTGIGSWESIQAMTHAKFPPMTMGVAPAEILQQGLSMLQKPKEMKALKGDGTNRREYSCPPNVVSAGVHAALEEHQAAAPLAGFRAEEDDSDLL